MTGMVRCNTYHPRLDLVTAISYRKGADGELAAGHEYGYDCLLYTSWYWPIRVSFTLLIHEESSRYRTGPRSSTRHRDCLLYTSLVRHQLRVHLLDAAHQSRRLGHDAGDGRERNRPHGMGRLHIRLKSGPCGAVGTLSLIHLFTPDQSSARP